MPATPLKRSSASNANATPTCAEPWALQTSERFGGYGSQYQSTTPRKTPGKTSGKAAVAAATDGVPCHLTTSTASDRWATPGERVRHTPTKPKPPAALRRHGPPALPDSHLVSCAGLASPAPNAYQRSEVETKPQHDGPSAAFAKAAFVERAANRFDGVGSIYDRGSANATPGVGAYDDHAAAAAAAAGAAAAGESCAAGQSTFVSRTDRFALPNSHYSAAAAAAPGVGVYDVAEADEKTQRLNACAVKLQAAIRRRQSRGIFAQLEKEARLVPAPGQYGPDIVPPPPPPRMTPPPSQQKQQQSQQQQPACLTVDDALTLLGAPTPALRAAAIQEEEEESEAAVAQALEELKEAPTPEASPLPARPKPGREQAPTPTPTPTPSRRARRRRAPRRRRTQRPPR